MRMAAGLEHNGRMAWLGLMIAGFVFCWPVGLAVLAYLTWSGWMGCWSMNGGSHWQERVQQRLMERRRGRHGWGGRCGHWSTGNRAFDEYRSETLRRLEEEEGEFRDFLDRLRFAKDKEEFDAFLTERRERSRSAPSEGA